MKDFGPALRDDIRHPRHARDEVVHVQRDGFRMPGAGTQHPVDNSFQRDGRYLSNVNRLSLPDMFLRNTG